MIDKFVNIRLFGGPCDGQYLKNHAELEVIFVKKQVSIDKIDPTLCYYKVYAYVRTNLYDKTNHLRLYIYELIDK